MDDNNAALGAQHLLSGMSDDPMRFAERPFAALYKQCWRERYGHNDGMNYMSVPF